MKINYKIKSEDIIAWNVHHLKQVPHIKKLQFRNRMLISLLYGLIAIIWFICEPKHWPFAWILMFISILWYWFYPTVLDYRIAKKLGKAFKGKEFSVQELSFSNHGIWAKSAVKEGQIPWTAIKRVVYCTQHIFLYLSEDNAIIIPKNALVDIAWTELVDCIKEWWKRKEVVLTRT